MLVWIGVCDNLRLSPKSLQASLGCAFFLRAGGCVDVPFLRSNFRHANMIMESENVGPNLPNSQSSDVAVCWSFSSS